MLLFSLILIANLSVDSHTILSKQEVVGIKVDSTPTNHKTKLINHENRFSLMEDQITYLDTSIEGVYAGNITRVIRFTDTWGEAYLIFGKDYVYLNSTKDLFVASNIIYVAYGDLNMDGVYEIVVLTNKDLYALNRTLDLIWSAGVDQSYGFNRITVANITSPNYSLVVLWKYESNTIAYYDANGSFLEVDTLTSTIGVSIIDMSYAGKYLLAKSSDQSYILSWRYGDTVALVEYGYTASGLDRANNTVYALSYKLSETRIVKFEYDSELEDLVISEVRVSGSMDIVDLLYYSTDLVVRDMDGDGLLEFLTWNQTNLLQVDQEEESIVQRITDVSTPENISVSDGWIYVLSGESVSIYTAELLYRGTILIERSIGLIEDTPIVYCDDGSAYRLAVDIDIELEPTFLSVGWRIVRTAGGLLAYNGIVVKYLGKYEWVKNFGYPIYKAFLDNDDVIVILKNKTVVVVRNKTVLWRNTLEVLDNFTDATFISESNTLVFATDRGELLLKNATSETKYDLGLSGNVSIADLHSEKGSLFLLAYNWTSSGLDIQYYINNSNALSYEYPIEGAVNAIVKGEIWDSDEDGVMEVAYVAYIENSSKAYAYLGAIENTTLVWMYATNATINSEDSFNAYLSADRFAYIVNETEFVVYPDLGFELNLNGTAKCASNGIFLTSEDLAILTTRGIVYVDLGGSICAGYYGALTRAFVLSNYTLLNVTAGIDTEDPQGVFIGLENGSVVNSANLHVEWEASDDLFVEYTVLYVDNEEVVAAGSNYSCDVRGLEEGEHTLSLMIVDAVGRVSWLNITIIVDLPIDLFVDLSNDTIYRALLLNISIAMYGPVDNMSVYLNDTLYGDYGPFNGSLLLNFSGEGCWILRFVLRGYMDTRELTYVVYVDLTPPAIKFSDLGNGTIINVSSFPVAVNVSGEALDNLGVDSVYMYSGGVWISINPDFNLSLIVDEEGEYVLLFLVTDYAGYTSNISFVFYINAIAELLVHFDYNGSWIRNNTVEFSWESRFIDYVELYVGDSLMGKLDPNGTTKITINDGIWEIRIVGIGFMDEVSKEIVVKIDSHPPTISLLGVQNDTVFKVSPKNPVVKFTVNITDSVGIANISILLNDTAVNISGSEVVLKLQEGKYRLDITATDYAGNSMHIVVIFSVVYEEESPLISVFIVLASLVAGVVAGMYVIKKKLGVSSEIVRQSQGSH